jgi:hypothetical protein
MISISLNGITFPKIYSVIVSVTVPASASASASDEKRFLLKRNFSHFLASYKMEQPQPHPVHTRPFAIPLDMIIGDTSHLECEMSDIVVKGLIVRCWIYRSKEIACSKPAIIGIHGGPAFTHRYILPLKLLADAGHAVILYDQGNLQIRLSVYSSFLRNRFSSGLWRFLTCTRAD